METDYKTVIEFIQFAFESLQNPSDAYQMQGYMKGKFPFYGVKATPRKSILKEMKEKFPFIKKVSPTEFCLLCFEQEQREWHQFGVDWLIENKKKLNPMHLPDLERILLTHSWWDTVDMIATHVIGEIFKKYPNEIPFWISKWRNHSDLWLNRTSLLFQLKYKAAVDTDLMADTIRQFALSKEFFIQKAIGWILRDYSQYNSEWVSDFVAQVELKPLSKREALRKMK